MKIIQFTCQIPQVSDALKALMFQQINTWSRLQRLATDPEYVTQPFGADVWHTHTTNPTLHWADWDAIYGALGDDGRVIADQFFGDGPMQGLLLMTDLLPTTAPGVRLHMVDVDDLAVEGYVQPPDEFVST